MSRKLIEKRLVIASHNEGKIREIKALLEPFGIDVVSSKELSLIEPEETGETYLENALIKAKACSLATGLPAISDDSGVEVSALNNQPGVHTAPYTKEHGGLARVFELWASDENILKNHRASFVCVQVLWWPDGHFESFESRISGKLTFPPRGTGGHGYDPVFVPDGHEKTIAQMSLLEKNTCSHRFLSTLKLIEACITA